MDVDHPLLTIDAATRAATITALQDGLAGESDLQYGYLFGSFSLPGPFHDIDVAVRYERMTPTEADRRAFDLGGRLAEFVRFPLDVVALNGRPVTFCFHVFRGSALAIRDDDALTADLERTAREYFDIERTLRHATREAFAT
jgi:predicted nucleotidyltransferase